MRHRKSKTTRRYDFDIPCAFAPRCWEHAMTSGFCAACYAAVRRLVSLPYGEIAKYFRKVGRLQERYRQFETVTRGGHKVRGFGDYQRKVGR